MVALYITSTGASGKTALCAGIGRQLIEQGIKVGYFIPVQLFETRDADDYKDAAFVREVLTLTEPVEQLCHIRLSRKDLWRSLTDEVDEFIQRLKQSYRKISRGKNVILMEGLNNVDVDKVSTLACYTIAEALNARVIFVLSYYSASELSRVVQIGKKLGRRLVGVVINFVPEPRIGVVKQELAHSLQGTGIRVIGILPEVRGLLGVTVGELAETLGGEILCCPESRGEIIENIMLGAMTPDSGVDYFSRKVNKAVVVRGERADMQLAALQTSTKCLILSGGVRPLPVVMSRAEENHVPIVGVKQDTFATITGIEEALAKARFRDLEKLRRFENLLKRYFDFKDLYVELGLKV